MKITEWLKSIFVKNLPKVKLRDLDKKAIANKAIKRIPQWKLAQQYGVPEEVINEILSNSAVFSKHKKNRRMRESRVSRRKNINKI